MAKNKGGQSDNTDAKQNPPHLFQPGQSGNPKGRPKGARNKLGEEFLNDMLSAWGERGAEVINDVIQDKPDVFLRVVASILPKQIEVKDTGDDLTEEELVERLAIIQTRIADAIGKRSGSSDEASTGQKGKGQPTSVH